MPGEVDQFGLKVRLWDEFPVLCVIALDDSDEARSPFSRGVRCHQHDGGRRSGYRSRCGSTVENRQDEQNARHGRAGDEQRERTAILLLIFHDDFEFPLM